ncbi:unnamed protein product [Blepharisma stoltei]|uniref:Cyclic nucleotide-binding domain-containing protein n=1 Tax=Blepharisma stoltei TaxID=1481888 RepID=A0AAU9IRQ4_9CILI|nr:unnamed protein product [Blepharisma stoltei]
MSIISILRKRNKKVLPIEYSQIAVEEKPFTPRNRLNSIEDAKKPQDSFIMTLSTEPVEQIQIDQPSPCKYKRIWQRMKWKVMMDIRMKGLINDIKKYGTDDSAFFFSKNDSCSQDEYYQKKADTVLHSAYSSRDNPVIPKYIINPSGWFKLLWDFYIAFWLLYTAVVTPFVIAFLTTSVMDAWFWIDFATDISFLLDTLIHLNTAYFNKDDILVTSRKKIFYNYLFGWFLIDLFASIPFGMIEVVMATDTKSSLMNQLVKLLKIKSLPRLFRLTKLTKMLKQQTSSQNFENIQIILNINHSITRLVGALSVIAISLHLVGCMWFYTARFDGFTPETWVVRLGYIDSSVWDQYLTCIYWAMTTLATVGYGDINAYTTFEKFIAMVWMICGVYFLSFSIGSLSSMYSNIDIMKNLIDHKIQVSDDFARETNVSKDIKHKMIKTIRIRTEKVAISSDDKEELLNEFPKKLRYDIALSMHKGIIKKFSFFTLKDYTFIAGVVPYLQPLMIGINEMICAKGEVPHTIYFISSGRVCFIYGYDNIVYRVLQEGHYFGDAEVVRNVLRKYNICAETDVVLLVMTKKLIEKIQFEFPAVWKEIVHFADEREKKIIKALAEMKALVKANKNGLIKTLKAIEFKEIIAKEICEIEKEINEESEREDFKYSEKMKFKEMVTISEQLKENTKLIDRLQDIVTKIEIREKRRDYLPEIKISTLSTARNFPDLNFELLEKQSSIGSLDTPNSFKS